MKFEDYLMQHADDKQKRFHLEEEVEKLQAELGEEQTINKVLHCALHGHVSTNPWLASSLLPPQVQGLIGELAMVEEEIVRLERRVDELKLTMYKERKQTEEWKLKQHQQRQWKLSLRHHTPLPPSGLGNPSILKDETHQPSRSQHYEEFRKEKMIHRRASVGSAAELLSMLSTEDEKSRRRAGTVPNGCEDICYVKPNELSEELIKCLIGIFLDVNQGTQGREGTNIVRKVTLSCMTSKGSNTAFNCKASLFPISHNASNLDPYGIMPDFDSTVRDIGAYKNFIQITRHSLDSSRLPQCLQTTGKLRALIHKLGTVDLTFLTYKQKLAFWINIYNSCIMHAFLEHGLPSSQERQLAIMNKAAMNVGGIVLNALAIEHFILRHPCETKHGPVDEKEMLLRHAYGLGYPEPNVTFALCRGSWSSPALRVYTPDEVVSELGKAKLEYLEASVGVTSKRKIVVPKLLQWYMQDFADDMESLLEWIYSQLPRSGLLKRLMMECLNEQSRCPTTKMIEIQPYEYEFRYLLTM